YFPNEWGAGVAILFLLAYLGYVFSFIETSKFQKYKI
ncbi:uncharacterized protein METZ01_LOCUS477239, partial [marine metagenome]